MAKKARTGTAKNKTGAAKKMKAATKDGKLATTAKRMGRTLGRAAKGVDKVKAAVKKSASARRGKKKPQIDPEVEASRARNRALWKSQEKEATSIELAKHGTLVDERARVRSNIGMSWSNRKPR
jgi:hypothetical protein